MTHSTAELAERVARVLSRYMHDSRERAWDELLTETQKDEARYAARAAIAVMADRLQQQDRLREDWRAMTDALAAMHPGEDCTGIRCGVCRALVNLRYYFNDREVRALTQSGNEG